MMPNNSRMLCSSSTTSTRVSATDRGEAEGEGAAGARRRFHVNLAAVLLHDPLHEGEAEPAAVEFRGEEGLEDVTEVLDSITSPGRRNSGGFRANPTPSGVPVAMMLPAGSVMPFETHSMIASTGEIMSLVLLSCFTTPLTLSFRPSDWGSSISAAVTIPGPGGQG